MTKSKTDNRVADQLMDQYKVVEEADKAMADIDLDIALQSESINRIVKYINERFGAAPLLIQKKGESYDESKDG